MTQGQQYKRDALIIGAPTRFCWYRIRIEFCDQYKSLDGDQIVFAADEKSAILAAMNKAIPNGALQDMHHKALVVWASELEKINGPSIN
jgi:hypothetical protein